MMETIKVEGMMCEGCEKRVKNALSEIDGIENIDVSYKNGVVKFQALDNYDKSIVQETIEDLGYNVIEI